MNIGGGRKNIVRGVAGLIRRTSGYGGDYSVGSTSYKFHVPSPKVKFRCFFADFKTMIRYDHIVNNC